VIRGDTPHEPLRVVRAHPLGQDRALVHLHVVSDVDFRSLTRARIDSIAAHAGLSAKQRSVLEYLVAGYGPQEIATLMDITTRTVKFHQANVLQKLRVDSRAGLLRLIF
jgi:DNA-binding CsgD family transcriptional regulator